MKRLIFITCILLIAIISTIVNYTKSKYGYIGIISVLFGVSSYLIFKELRILWRFLTAYMFNLRTDFFDKRIERPRLFVYISFGTMAIISLYHYLHIQKITFFDQYFTTTSLVLLNVVSNMLLTLTWRDNFKETFITKIQQQIIKRNNKAFEFNEYCLNDLKTLYNNLIDNDFIELIDSNTDVNDTDKFAETLFNGTLPKAPIFMLNMDNIQTKYLWDRLVANSTGFTLDKFLLIFKNKNSNATRQSIETSFSNNKNFPKRKEDIDSCFNFLGKG
ncbi:ABC-type multidrug transport system fused ATPase/permease subunit [Myroides gitamensis]|uniref:hypothetical protein n=1 Tax=Myroides odoratus TaxID=256 RepID=UPI002168C4EA|nr:hypothetical protein [Myroides odoratus]MCS4238300.1 ABC-type multidrug transport system fused ATPase/permease subunit [Myroides odoratus]MDH6600895.1 ABC-type multidrug transport system fused ATPase/permease subunit [Myroides gitamensis]